MKAMNDQMNDQEMRLAAYVDGELDKAGALEVERLLASDARAREYVRVQREMTALLRGACADRAYLPPADDMKRFVAAPSQPWIRMRAVAAIAAALMIAVLSFTTGAYLSRTAETSELAELLDDVSAYHGFFARETDHLVEVPASRGAELAAWLGDRLKRKLTIPDLSSAGLTFAGGRMLVVNGRPVAQLIYTHPNELPLAVCITQAPNTTSGLQMVQKRGFDLAWWGAQGYLFLIVGNLPGERAKTLADMVASASRG